MTTNGKRILVIAAHPDDEVLGCGGTIAKLMYEGKSVCVALVGGARDQTAFRCAEKAANALGVCLYANLLRDVEDNALDLLPLIEIVRAIERIIETVKPGTIYTHHAGDLNIDHQIVNRAVITATRPIWPYQVREVYAFEVPSSSEWAFGSGVPFRPNAYQDISPFLGQKIEAMKCYTSEMRPYPHPRSIELLEAKARVRGSEVGVQAAEAFELVRMVR